MAESLNKNARLQIENHFLSMQQERYDNLKTAPARRRISIQAYMHSNRILLIQVKNTFNKEIKKNILPAS